MIVLGSVACVEPMRLHTLLTAAVVSNARQLRTVRQITDSSSGQHRPTDLQKWYTEKNTAHTQRIRSRSSSVETHEKDVTVSGVASKTENEPQNQVARHPESQSASHIHLNHIPSDTLIADHSSGTEVLARRLIGTCAQMEIITTTPPLVE